VTLEEQRKIGTQARELSDLLLSGVEISDAEIRGQVVLLWNSVNSIRAEPSSPK
jgi:hypothetical protein